MKKIILICGLILALFLLVSCTAPQKETVTKETSSSAKTTTTTPTKTTTETKTTTPTTETKTTTEVKTTTPTKTVDLTKEETITTVKDKKVTKLIETSKEVEGYRYFYQSLIRNSGGNYDTKSYQIYAKKDKIKKEYATPVNLNNKDYYDTVYLDTTKKTAVGTCSSNGVLCREILDKKFDLVYDKEKEKIIPHQLMGKIDASAKIVEEVRIENQEVSVLKYPVGKYTARLYVGTYYGIPLKYELYSVSGEDEVLEEKYEFKSLVVGQVKTTDVTLS